MVGLHLYAVLRGVPGLAPESGIKQKPRSCSSTHSLRSAQARVPPILNVAYIPNVGKLRGLLQDYGSRRQQLHEIACRGPSTQQLPQTHATAQCSQSSTRGLPASTKSESCAPTQDSPGPDNLYARSDHPASRNRCASSSGTAACGPFCSCSRRTSAQVYPARRRSLGCTPAACISPSENPTSCSIQAGVPSSTAWPALSPAPRHF